MVDGRGLFSFVRCLSCNTQGPSRKCASDAAKAWNRAMSHTGTPTEPTAKQSPCVALLWRFETREEAAAFRKQLEKSIGTCEMNSAFITGERDE